MRSRCFDPGSDQFAFFMSPRGHGRHGGPPGHGRGMPPDFGGPGGFPPFGEFFSSLFGGRGPRARRGDVRSGILALLAEKPFNGYQILQELEQRSHGVWRPSPGSVYPTLAQLEDEGLIRAEASGSGKLFDLTEEGRKYVKAHAEELREPWEAVSRAATSEDTRKQVFELAGMIRHVGVAAMQVARSGNAAQIDQARRVLKEARRSLYRILAEDEPEDAD